MSSVPMEDFEQRSRGQVVDWGGENNSEELWVRGGQGQQWMVSSDHILGQGSPLLLPWPLHHHGYNTFNRRANQIVLLASFCV